MSEDKWFYEENLIYPLAGIHERRGYWPDWGTVI